MQSSLINTETGTLCTSRLCDILQVILPRASYKRIYVNYIFYRLQCSLVLYIPDDCRLEEKRRSSTLEIKKGGIDGEYQQKSM